MLAIANIGAASWSRVSSIRATIVFSDRRAPMSVPRLNCATSKGLFRELNPGPLAPEARIMPLDQTASCSTSFQYRDSVTFCVAAVGGPFPFVEEVSFGMRARRQSE